MQNEANDKESKIHETDRDKLWTRLEVN